MGNRRVGSRDGGSMPSSENKNYPHNDDCARKKRERETDSPLDGAQSSPSPLRREALLPLRRQLSEVAFSVLLSSPFVCAALSLCLHHPNADFYHHPTMNMSRTSRQRLLPRSPLQHII
ncbi:hypothetical protein L7F22_034161 [Adiantum nelumboides]|nr:hypothetical protein [Adiantum nelumboides]